MKSYIPYSLLAAVAACGLATGAETAYTTPVGYVSVSIPANSDTTVAPSLSQAPLLQGASTAVSDNEITITTGAATGAFINALPDLNSKCYVLIRSGPLAGLRFPVTGNTGTAVTVNAGATTLQAQGFVAGNVISVVPYWTLNTLFPSGAGVGAATDIVDPRSFVLFSDQETIAANRAPSKVYFYFSGDAVNYPDYPAGWYDNDNLDGGLQNTVALDPAVLLTLRNSPATALTITGEVPSVALSTVLLTSSSSVNDELLGVPYPVDTTLAQSGLQSTIAPASDLVDPVDFVFVYGDTAAGFNKAPSKFYFYFSGDAVNYPEYPAGWYDNDNLDGGLVTDAVLKAGRSFGVRKAKGVSGTTKWTAPIPYSL